MLLRSWLASPHSARRHVVNEVMMLRIEPELLALAVKRHFGPLERPIGVAERAGAVLPGLRCIHSFGVAKSARVLDLAADLPLVVLA